MEKIDSNVLWAILAYVARDDKCANDFCEELGGKTFEFMRKCARLLMIYITKFEDPTMKNGIKMRKQTEDETMEEMRYNDHRRVLWPLQI